MTYRLSSKGRREFISTSLKVASALALMNVPLKVPAENETEVNTYTVQDVIDTILKEIPGAPFPNTVDTIKCGNVSNVVHGVVSTMFPTIDVIKAAIQHDANFIIAHEPTFYNHEDDLNFVPNNKIFGEKITLLQDHSITIWRFHDGWHSYKPDGITYGVLKKTGWLPYYETGKNVIRIPSTNLRELVVYLKNKLNIRHVKIIGNLNQQCERIALVPGAAGGQMQISLVEKEQPDVLVVGELREWETAEYIRDSVALGGKTSLVVLGHCVSEEPGMEWFADWLRPKVPGISIRHIPSGDPFQWM